MARRTYSLAPRRRGRRCARTRRCRRGRRRPRRRRARCRYDVVPPNDCPSIVNSASTSASPKALRQAPSTVTGSVLDQIARRGLGVAVVHGDLGVPQGRSPPTPGSRRGHSSPHCRPAGEGRSGPARPRPATTPVGAQDLRRQVLHIGRRDVTGARPAGAGRTPRRSGARSCRRRRRGRPRTPEGSAPATAARTSSSAAGPPTSEDRAGEVLVEGAQGAGDVAADQVDLEVEAQRAPLGGGEVRPEREPARRARRPRATRGRRRAAGSRGRTVAPSSPSTTCGASARRLGPRLTCSAAAAVVPVSSATQSVSRSPAPAATTAHSRVTTSIVPPPRSTTTASSGARGVLSAPRRAASASSPTTRTGTSRAADSAAGRVDDGPGAGQPGDTQ